MTGYDWDFIPNKKELPDPQTTHKAEGANVPIQKVGINHFESPIDYTLKAGQPIRLKGVFSGYVSLSADKKGINMSRIPICIDKHVDQHTVGADLLCNIAEEMLDLVETDDVNLRVKFDFPMKQPSLRSKDENGNPLEGWVYYPSELQVNLKRGGEPKVYLQTTFTYSSACPCSYTLAKDAVANRNTEAISHSQRSFATTTVQFDPKDTLHLEDLILHHREALKTECQVMVKREDEQAFAELNGYYPKFVEDATRLMFETLNSDSRILDFSTVCVHEESLHPHNAVGIIYKGIDGGLR